MIDGTKEKKMSKEAKKKRTLYLQVTVPAACNAMVRALAPGPHTGLKSGVKYKALSFKQPDEAKAPYAVGVCVV